MLDFVRLIRNYKKQCIVVVPMTFFSTKLAYTLLKHDTMRLSSSDSIKNFDNSDKKVCCYWLTTFPARKRKPLKVLEKSDFPKLDNYDAIEIGVCAVPKNYYGKIAVPINLPVYDYTGYKIIDLIRPLLKGSVLFKRYVIQKI